MYVCMYVGTVQYEVYTNGPLLEAVSLVVTTEESVVFDGVWMLLVHWDNVPLHNDNTLVII